jgi:hypothetical protein
VRALLHLVCVASACSSLACAPLSVQTEERPKSSSARLEGPPGRKPGPAVPPAATAAAVSQPATRPVERASEDPPWETPPGDVKCVLRGSFSPFPDACARPITIRSASGAPLMRLFMFQLPVVWGIRGRGERAWIHAREDIFAVTGFASLDDIQLRLLEKTTLVAGHVWARADAPVEVEGATASGALTVSVVDVPGIAELRVEVPCDGVSFDPADPAPLVPRPRSREERVWPRGDGLTLRGSPGGPSILTLSELGQIFGMDLRVRERSGGATRITFETLSTQIDAWVNETDLSHEPQNESQSGGSCDESEGEGGLGEQVKFATVLESAWSRVGPSPDRATPAVRIGVGAKLRVGEVRGGFVEARYTGRLRMVGDNRLWIPASALSATEVAGE